MIECLHDRVLIRRIDEPPKGIVLTDADKSQVGVVVAVGPGKWVPGHWAYSYEWVADANGIHWPSNERRTWVDGYRDDWGVRAGEKVLFNSRWNDLGDNHERGNLAHGEHEHFIQLADIYGTLNV